MARPRDWGEHHPGDFDDQFPPDPTAGYSEIDYGIGGPPFDALEQPVRRAADFVPDSAAEPEDLPRRTDYSGIILGWANPQNQYPRLYWVARQDGALGIARTLDDVSFADFRPGDAVGIVEDTFEDAFIIISTPRPDELSTLDVAYFVGVADLAGNGPFRIEFDTTRIKYPVDNSWGHFNEIILDANGIPEVKEEGVYDIDFNVSVEHVEVVDVFPFSFGTDCINEGTTEQVTNGLAYKLNLDRNVGFSMRRDHTDCEHHLTLETPLKNSILNAYSGYKDGRPVFTSAPVIGSSLNIAADEPDAWLKIGPQRGSNGHAWIGRGRQSKKMMFRMPPTEPETSCDFIVVDRYTPPIPFETEQDGFPFHVETGHLVELAYKRPGGTGTLKSTRITGYVECCGYDIPIVEAIDYVVENGLIISGYCIEEVSCNKTGRHFDSRDKAYSPCDPEADAGGFVTLRGQFLDVPPF